MLLKPGIFCAGLLFTYVPVVSADIFIPPCDPQCQQTFDAAWRTAKQLANEGQFEAAVQQYSIVIAEIPMTVIAQDAALSAAHALVKVGKLPDALPFYDTAIAIGEARASEMNSKACLIMRRKHDALFERAETLEKMGDHDAAFSAYHRAVDTVFADLSAEVPSATMRQERAANLQFSALVAGTYLEKHGDTARAMLAYDQIIAIADARADTADGENLTSMLDAKRNALLKKAQLCQREGCVDQARLAIQRIFGEFPVSQQVCTARFIEAQLNNGSTAEAEFLSAREQHATAVLDQAFQSPLTDVRLAGADQVIAGFPDTNAATAALEKKARLLADETRDDEAITAYIQVLDRLRPTAPHSELFQSSRVRLKYLQSKVIYSRLNDGYPPPEKTWNEYRALCSEIIEQDTRPDEAAWGIISLAESYGLQKRFAESLEIVQQFLAEHDPNQFKEQTAEAQFFAGADERIAGRYDSALTHLRWVTDQSGIDYHTPWGKKLTAFVYYQTWHVLKETGAADSAVSQVLAEFTSKIPEATEGVKLWELPGVNR